MDGILGFYPMKQESVLKDLYLFLHPQTTGAMVQRTF